VQGLGLWTVLGAAALGLVWLFPRWGRGSRLLALATGLLAGGIVGNLLDGSSTAGSSTSSISGGVDPGPVLNPADVALGVGAILATVALYRAVFRTSLAPASAGPGGAPA
jgi:lipoprotein signal peptidase